MAGKIKKIIEEIAEKKSNGNPSVASSVKTKMIIKGVMVPNYTTASVDDPEIIKKLLNIASELNVKVDAIDLV